MSIEKDRIAGVVVLYHPDDNLITNVESYLPHINILLVIDNSEVINHYLITQLSKHPQIIYIANQNNLGIAKALNIGAENAIQRGYTWLLTMDQDSKFNDGSFFQCFDYVDNLANTAIISPHHFEDQTVDINRLFDYQEVEIIMTSGNLVNLALFNTVGKFEEKLFIDEVDHDYCLKAKQKGYKIIVFKNIVLHHKLGTSKEIIRTGKKEIISEHSANRMYYLTRNNLYLYKKYHKYFPEVVSLRMRNFLVICRNILFYEENKLSKVSNIVRGCFDFLRNKYGK